MIHKWLNQNYDLNYNEDCVFEEDNAPFSLNLLTN